MEITFDQAIELLEITDISKVTVEEIPRLEKKNKKRWHPDRVAHLKDSVISQEYTEKFQQIEVACQMVLSYLQGTYQAGETFSQPRQSEHQEPVEVIRNNAAELQTKLRDLWTTIKEKQYKWTVKEVLLSDGFVLRDLLREDFKEDLAILSIISFFYGLLILGILTGIATLISPIFGAIVGIVLIVQSLSCIMGLLPLSRFWLPDILNNIMIVFINFGLGVYHWAERQVQNSGNVWVGLLVRLPVLFAKLVKYLVLFPLYEIAKLIIGGKVVGVVKQQVNYYADCAEWYIDDLLVKNPSDMTDDELFHLSYIYSELSSATR